MKTEQIFCDICGKEGATTRKKGGQHPVAGDGAMNEKEIFLDKEKTLPFITLSFAKKNIGGGVFDIDICNRCQLLIQEQTGTALFNVYVPFKDRFKKTNKKSLHNPN